MMVFWVPAALLWLAVTSDKDPSLHRVSLSSGFQACHSHPAWSPVSHLMYNRERRLLFWEAVSIVSDGWEAGPGSLASQFQPFCHSRSKAAEMLAVFLGSQFPVLRNGDHNVTSSAGTGWIMGIHLHKHLELSLMPYGHETGIVYCSWFLRSQCWLVLRVAENPSQFELQWLSL